MRYKEFNRNRVLEKAINLFWNKGFGGCSVKELVEETQVNRFSLYNEFENKEGILYASMELYKQRHSSKKLASDFSKQTLADELIAFFSAFFLDEEEHPPGCYTIHIATELADTDETVKLFLDAYTKELEEKFSSILSQFQPNNEGNSFYARHLVVLFCSSMCHCVIQSPQERIAHISSSIQILLNNKMHYATHA